MNSRQRQFVQEYLRSGCAKVAAERAGYSPRTAYSQGPRLLKNVEVARAISQAQLDAGMRTEITLERVLTELAKLAFGPERDHLKIRALEELGRRVECQDRASTREGVSSAISRVTELLRGYHKG
ncbi:MAG: terminase small subunit [Bdellovibrionales bacterium]|nr:terminase small subunit [Bdellovibrionales bacterium]